MTKNETATLNRLLYKYQIETRLELADVVASMYKLQAEKTLLNERIFQAEESIRPGKVVE